MTRPSGGETEVHEQNVQSTTPDRLPGEQMKCGVMDDETRWETEGQENKSGKNRKWPSESVKRLPKETLLLPSTVADGALPDDANGSSGSLTASSSQAPPHPLRARKHSVMLQDAMLLVEAMGQSKNRISAQENPTAQSRCTPSVAPSPHQEVAPQSPPTTNESHQGAEEESPSETDTRTTEPGNSQPLGRDPAVPHPKYGLEPSVITPTSFSTAAVSNSLEHPGSVLAEASETTADSDLIPLKMVDFSQTPSSNSQGTIAPLSPNQISAVVPTVAAAQNKCTLPASSSAGLPQGKNDATLTTADPFMTSEPTVGSTEQSPATLSTVNVPQKCFPLLPVIRLKRLSYPVLSSGSVSVSQLLSRESKSEVVPPDCTSSLVNDQAPKTMPRPSGATASSSGARPETKNAFVAQTSSVSWVSEKAGPSSALREAAAPALSASIASEPVSEKTVDLGKTGLSAESHRACKTVTADEKGIGDVEKDLLSQNDFSNPLQSTPITRDLPEPRLQLRKTEFLARLAVTPVIQDAKKTSSSESADGHSSRQGSGRSRMSKSHRKSFLARLGVHLKACLRAKRAKTNARALTEEMDIPGRSTKNPRLENAGKNGHESTHEPGPLPTSHTASSLSPAGPRSEMEFSPANLGNRRRTNFGSPENKTPFEAASVTRRKPIVSLYRLALKSNSSPVQNITIPSKTKFPAKTRKRSLSPKQNASVEKIRANCSPSPSARAKTLPSPPRMKSIGARPPPRLTPVSQADSRSIPNDPRPQPCHSNSCIFSRGEKTCKQESDTFLGKTASPKWTENGAGSSKIEAATAENSSLNQKSPAEEDNEAMPPEPRAAVPPMRPRSGNGKKLLKNQCEDCGRILSSSAALESHVSLHTGHRPFPCARCGKSFPDARGLKRHGHVHCNGRLHICQQCGKGFVYGFGLNKHLQMVHGKRKPFVCQLCNKAFFTKRDVETHIRTHTGEKPYHCHLCEKKFVRSVELNAHLRWHRGEKRHWCPYCGKGFFDQNNLKRHKYIHTGEKPHSCPHCPKHFTQSGHLKKHVKNVHKVQ
ncbi:uncharacterized protein LOC127599013 [Hippocampus zosterae]|uniref:uncharacterized protein LOC127599013 n=1 Tax=Hippocampus zosterae TaxID=109293 RepID=UPI00223D93E6|nr:uncharacterized protein LOC127599013 [Hippocampus zosterae]